MFIHIVSFTAGGAKLCAKLVDRLGPDCAGFAPVKYCTSRNLKVLGVPVSDWAAERFNRGDALVFVSAAGIAIRSVAALLTGKGEDPAVLCVDEGGKYVIPLLSSHLGGGNLLAKRIAKLLKAQAILTTATDVRGVFAVDNWAVANNCNINNISDIKHVSAALLDGQPVGLVSDFPIEGDLPPHVHIRETGGCGILIAIDYRSPFTNTLHLIPKCLRVGIGCRKGADAYDMEKLLLQVLEKHRLPVLALESFATVSLKVREPAILELCERYGVPLRVSTPQQLAEVEDSVASSDFVLETVGVDNVCERAALYGGGALLVEKTVGNGVAIAIAKTNWRAAF